MLTKEELEQSPLFENISYDEYRRMLSCFQAVQKSFRPDELIYDFSAPGSDAVGIVERGDAVLIRIDEDGVSTVMEELGVGGVFGRTLAFAGAGPGTAWRSCAALRAMCCSLIMPIFSSAVKTPAPTTACWCRICSGS